MSRAEMVTKSEILKYLRKQASKGGKATARKLTPEERTASARKAAQARWAKVKKGLTAGQ